MLYLSCNYFCTLYLLVKVLLVKLENLSNLTRNTSACLNINYGTTEEKPKNEGCKAGTIY